MFKKGRKHTKESNEKNRQSLLKHYKKNPISDEVKEKHRQSALKQFQNGMPQETREKIRKKVKNKYKDPEYGRQLTEKRIKTFARLDVKKKMRESQKGNTNGFKKGNRLSVGKRNGRWKGGISNNPYPTVWTKELRQAIRQRDKYICQISSYYPSFSVHHIDYDKNNCEPENLITLSNRSHSKTNSNREHWIEYFRNKKQNII